MPQESSNTASLARALQDWFRACPLLQGGARVGVDYLPDSPTEYAVYATPSTIRTRENVLGEEIPEDVQTQNFTFAAKEPFGADILQNIKNQAFFEAIIEWVWEQNEARNLPAVPNAHVRSVVPTLTAFIADASGDVARYQISLKITYRRA